MRISTVFITSILLFSACSHQDKHHDASSNGLAESKTLFSEEESRIEIDSLMENWHAAAAKADAKVYFGLMSEESIYLGTDKTERWTKSEFESFARPYFERGKAWSFKAVDRYILFSRSGDTAWLDERLDTWMGPCRGSAVLTRGVEGDWKIAHYDLSYMVDNALMDSVIALTGSAPPR